MEVEQLLEVESGRAQPATIGLSPGETVGPLSIGRMGGWRVAANGVAAEHGWIYFDGKNLYLQSVDLAAPLYVDGQPVPGTWTPVHAPCTITLGAAKLSFIAAAEEIERTADKFPAPAAPQGMAEPPRPPTPRPSARPFAPGELAHRPEASDATRMGPMDVMAARARASALARPSVPRAHSEPDADLQTMVAPRSQPPSAAPPATSPPAIAPTSHPGAPRDVAPADPRSSASPPGSLVDKPTTVQEIKPPAGVLAKWREASFAQKATLFLLPLALASVYVIFTEPPHGSGEVADDPAAAASASSAPAVAASASAGPSPPPPSSEIAAAPVTAMPTLGAAGPPPTSAPGTIDAAPARPDPEPPPRAVVPARPGASPQRTLERRAADSVAAGDWEGAAQLYEDLAKQHPDEPAFAEAARILRARSR